MTTCKPRLSLEEKELAILRRAVDTADKIKGAKIVNDPDVEKLIKIVEQFLTKKRLVCYGGTAINNILPVEDQFYNKDIEFPDYDFYSPNALEDAKELADIYYAAGYTEVEAKAGVHHGTYKVFVDFIPIADITQLDKKIFSNLQKDGIRMNGIINGIIYCPPSFLRMNMYLELSRPSGDVSRWEKVLKRLILLNKNFPIKVEGCEPENFQRDFDLENTKLEGQIFYIARDSFIHQGAVFFGGYASSLYSQHMPKKTRDLFHKTPDFDVLSENPSQTADMLKARLNEGGYKKVKIIKHDGIAELIGPHYEVKVNVDKKDKTIAFIYEPLACHSYNVIKIGKKHIRIATIDTMLSFYLAFLYAGREYYDKKRISCMAEYLFSVQQKNRLEQKGVLKRFSIKCYGKQQTLEVMRAEKAEMFKTLKDDRTSKEYESWFLRYVPFENDQDKQKKLLQNQILNRRVQKRRNEQRKIQQKNDFSYSRFFYMHGYFTLTTL